MTDKTDSKERDLMALVDAYAEARHIGGCHTYNAKTAEARNAVIAKLAPPGFDAADMATAWSNGFRDGVASLAASAGSEPVAWREHVEQRLLTWRQRFVNRSGDQLALDDFMDKQSLDDLIDFVCDEWAPLTHPSPPEGMVSAYEVENLRRALQFYANKDHFAIADEMAWDTVSGEPQNYWCDEAGTAMVEDGSIAKMALAGHHIQLEEDDDEAAPPTSSADSRKGE